MAINTASAAISFARELEESGARFYEGLAQEYPQNKDLFLSLATENRKNVAQVERAYYSVISDAIEGCFAFNITPEKYVLKTELPAGGYAGAVKRAIEIEETMVTFYSEAAEQSKCLLADVPQALALIGRKRNARQTTLKSLLGKG